MKNKNYTTEGLVILTGLMMMFFFNQCNIFDPINDPPLSTVGDTLWMQPILGSDSLFTEPTLAIGTNGDLYYAVAGGTLYWTKARIRALNPQQGVMRWESPVLDNIGLNSPILVSDDGTIYAIGKYRLYAINPVTGQFNWIWEVPNELPFPGGPGTIYSYGDIGALSLTDNGNLILGSVGTGVYSRAIYCISPSGVMLWYNMDANNGAIYSGTVVGPGNRIHYFTSMNGQIALVTVDATSGAILWTKPIQSMSSSVNNLALDSDGTIIASFQLTSSDPFRMYRIHPADGSILWQSSHDSNANPKLVGPDGSIFQDDNNFSGLVKYIPGQSSGVSFSANIHANLEGTVFTKANQLLTIRNRDWVSTLHAFSSTGHLDWYVPIGYARENVMALSTQKVVFGVRSDLVFAIQGDQTMSDKGWPKRYHDIRNTSNVTK